MLSEFEHDIPTIKISDDEEIYSCFEIRTRYEDSLNRMQEIVDSFSLQYRKLRDVEGATIETLGEIGANVLEIRFEMDRRNNPIYRDATANSLSQARSKIVHEMVDALMEEANFDPNDEQVVAYALLSLTDGNQLDLRWNVKLFLEDTFFFWREPFRLAEYPAAINVYARGDAVSPIDGGNFSVDALINLN